MTFRYRIAGGAAEVSAAQSALAAWMEAAGASLHSVTRAEVVLEELALNAQRHGGALEVLVEASIAVGLCTLVLEDAGRPFDPTVGVLPLPAASLGAARIGGLGLALVRRNAAALRYTRTGMGRNRVEVDLPLC
ncbi:ATP-binding protein [Belnapia sp. T18]|uniref:ATP-binding protein n=1 Tax=Belnapia arida TaxID=2804533 RepID=A0ABS1TXG5_9PROT|nr:ATP-binding protein [Belnapia arida]MBL6076920.1 ATP-binding protein [Belnapia arida]